MAYDVIILGHLHMPLYFLGTFTEYPYLEDNNKIRSTLSNECCVFFYNGMF